MGMLVPCLTAAIMNCCAIQLFREPVKIGNGPLMALYIFIFTCFILLWSVRLYPRNLRKIGKLQVFIEFLCAEFLMEDLVVDFWFPLEKSIHDAMPNLAQHIEDWLSVGDWSAEFITDILKNENFMPFCVSYALAIFFLIAALHASRVIDLRTLKEEGPVCFLKEIFRKLKLGIRRLLRSFGIVKRKVKINESRNTHQEAFDYCSAILSSPKPKSRNNQKKMPKNDHCRTFCPSRSHCKDTDGSSLDDFEDLGSLSDFDC